MNAAAVWAGVWGLVAIGCGVRALYHPHRAVVQTGRVESCAGDSDQGCSSALQIGVAPGVQVFAAGVGRVIEVTEDRVDILLSQDLAILSYEGLIPEVQTGQYVSNGQPIGMTEAASPTLRFRVLGIERSEGKGLRYYDIWPSSYLASRGYRIASELAAGGEQWCAQGRNITVPATAAIGCKMRLAPKTGFSLLGSSAEVEQVT